MVCTASTPGRTHVGRPTAESRESLGRLHADEGAYGLTEQFAFVHVRLSQSERLPEEGVINRDRRTHGREG